VNPTLTELRTVTLLSISPSHVTLRHQLVWTWYSPEVLCAMETIKWHETQKPVWTTSVKMAKFDAVEQRWKPLELASLLLAANEQLPS